MMSYTWQLACYLLDVLVLLWRAMEPVVVLCAIFPYHWVLISSSLIVILSGL